MPARKKASETTEARNTLTVSLDARTNHEINRWLDKNRGRGKSEFVRMLIEWFTSAPASFQQIVAGAVPPDMLDEYAKRAHGFLDEAIRRASSQPERTQLSADGTAKAQKSKTRVFGGTSDALH